MFIRKEIRLYFGDAPARFALATAVASPNPMWNFATLWDLFDLSRLEMVDDDKISGLQLLSQPLDSFWLSEINDLLEDPQGEFFIDDNQYAGIALHMVKYMSADLKYVPPLDILTLLLMSLCRSYLPLEASVPLAKIFPNILAKSSIRPDLVECFRTPTLAAAYLKNDSIANAITTYISVSNSIAAHPLRLTHSQRSHGGAEIISKFLRHVESLPVILIS
jgi:hypothetical protein